MLVGILGTTAACGGSDAGNSPMADAPAAALRYEAFTSATHSMTQDNSVQLSTTDLVGPIACGLSGNQSAGLGTSGSEILLAFHDPDFQHCPVGTYAVRSDCQPPAGGSAVPEGCAYYRRYDQFGVLLGTLPAIAGAIGVSGTETSCTIQVNLSFDGQTHSDTFTLSNWPMAWPWCM